MKGRAGGLMLAPLPFAWICADPFAPGLSASCCSEAAALLFYLKPFAFCDQHGLVPQVPPAGTGIAFTSAPRS